MELALRPDHPPCALDRFRLTGRLVRVLVDMDGPMAGFDAKAWMLFAHHGWEVDATETTQIHRYATDHIVDRRHRDAARAHMQKPGWFRDLPPVPGAIEGILRLEAHPDVDEVYLCTKPMERNPSCRDDKGAWVEEHLGDDWVQRLIITPDKSVVDGAILLDDAPKLEWIPRAPWNPVIFRTLTNGPGTKWGHIPAWDWSDPIEDLLAHLPVPA